MVGMGIEVRVVGCTHTCVAGVTSLPTFSVTGTCLELKGMAWLMRTTMMAEGEQEALINMIIIAFYFLTCVFRNLKIIKLVLYS